MHIVCKMFGGMEAHLSCHPAGLWGRAFMESIFDGRFLVQTESNRYPGVQILRHSWQRTSQFRDGILPKQKYNLVRSSYNSSIQRINMCICIFMYNMYLYMWDKKSPPKFWHNSLAILAFSIFREVGACFPRILHSKVFFASTWISFECHAAYGSGCFCITATQLWMCLLW